MSESTLHLESTSSAAQRGLLWLPLLQRLTVISQTSVVWKNASSALAGHGDLDVIAPRPDWSAIEAEFHRWVAAAGLQPVAVCRHVPGSMFLLAVDPERSAFFELDIKARGTFRGTTIFEATDLQPLCELDTLGFRRLRPGTEGLLKLIMNGTTDDGRLDSRRVDRERIVELLRDDRAGAHYASLLFGSAAAQVLDLVTDFLQEEWTPSRMLALRKRLRLALLFEPATLAQRVWWRVGPDRECRGIKALIKEGTLVPGDLTSLQQIVRAHPARHAIPPT